jgi:ABC-type transport system involved in cytochrome c biogenesis ATPase subunit
MGTLMKHLSQQSKLIIMDETVTHIFKQDASKLEDTMSKGHVRKTTSKGNVYFSIQTEEETADVNTTPIHNKPMCKPTQYQVNKHNNKH